MIQVRPPQGAWDEYWRRTEEGAAHRAGGPQDETLARFWTPVLATAMGELECPRVLDVGCGNGAVLHHVAQAARVKGTQPAIVGIDTSASALREMVSRFPRVAAVSATATCPPFVDESFDVLTSQFGLEYAGVAAIEPLARLLAPRGTLAAILHLRAGAMFRENEANLAAMQALMQSQLVEATQELFRAHEAVRRGRGSRPRLRAAQESHDRASAAAAQVLRLHGRHVAGGAIARICDDVSKLALRTEALDAAEVIRWTELVGNENRAYAGRLSSMLAVALDEASMEELARRAQSRGLLVRMRHALLMGSRQEPAAWAFLAVRG